MTPRPCAVLRETQCHKRFRTVELSEDSPIDRPDRTAILSGKSARQANVEQMQAGRRRKAAARKAEGETGDKPKKEKRPLKPKAAAKRDTVILRRKGRQAKAQARRHL